MNDLHKLKKYINYTPVKSSVLLKCTNPQAYIRAKEYEADRNSIPNFDNRLAELKRMNNKAINLNRNY